MSVLQISEEDLKLLTSMAEEASVSAEALMHEAIQSYAGPHRRGKDWSGLDAAFGIWKDRDEDALAYQRRIRGE